MFYNTRITYDDDRHSGTDERPDSTVSHRQPATIKYNVLVPLLFIDFFLFDTGILRLRVFYFFFRYIWNIIIMHSSNSLRVIQHAVTDRKLHYNTSKPEIKNTSLHVPFIKHQ